MTNEHSNCKYPVKKLLSATGFVAVLLAGFGELAIASDSPAIDGMHADFQNLDKCISDLELTVFGAANEGQPSLIRLEALEQKEFGSVQSGSLYGRLADLQERIRQQNKVDLKSATLQPQKAKVDGGTSANRASGQSIPKRVLKAEVNDDQLLEYGIEIGSKQNQAGRAEHFVKKVLQGSRAERYGIISGDIVLAMQTSPTAMRITIEREGKIYSADLSHERESESHAQVALQSGQRSNQQNVTRPALSPLGHFAGTIWEQKDINHKGPYNWVHVATTEINAPVTTEFQMSANGQLVGSYYLQAYQPGTPYGGTLDNAQILSERQLFMQWHDKNGTGFFLCEFSPDFNSFQGWWSPDPSRMPLQDANLSAPQTPDQLKLYGLRHYGARVRQ
ncbi:MAG: hypothetical protein P4L53_12605 [Candidatus Obscuribacterales bacterium]|nr:hypothetical protein [Candidatus Obscuribacterales bacterium]